MILCVQSSIFPQYSVLSLLQHDVIPSSSIDKKAEVFNGFRVRIFISTLPPFYVAEVGHWCSRDRFTFAKYFNDNMPLMAYSL